MPQKVKRFDKYEVDGPYHWMWYQDNKGGHKDLVDIVVGKFVGAISVLDVGCGDGLLSCLLADGRRVVGIDTSRTGIELAREAARKLCKEVEFRVESAEEVEGVFDAFLMFSVIEHLKDPEKVLKRLNKMCEWGIIITDDGSQMERGEYDQRLFTEKELVELANKCGWKVGMVRENKTIMCKVRK